jgi:hypothetical protein
MHYAYNFRVTLSGKICAHPSQTFSTRAARHSIQPSFSTTG